MKKANELKEKTKAELGKLLKEKYEELRVARFKHAGKELKNIQTIGEIKRTIARILTIVKEKDSLHETT